MKRREPLPRKTFFELPPLELECMKALWAQGEASVKDIRAQLNGANGRALAYTTIETIMDRLARKGVVARRKAGRAHLYTPLYEAAAARADAVEVLVHHFFAGSRRALASYLAGETIPGPKPRPAQLASRNPVSVPRSATAQRAAAPPARKPAPGTSDRRLDTSLL